MALPKPRMPRPSHPPQSSTPQPARLTTPHAPLTTLCRSHMHMGAIPPLTTRLTCPRPPRPSCPCSHPLILTHDIKLTSIHCSQRHLIITIRSAIIKLPYFDPYLVLLGGDMATRSCVGPTWCAPWCTSWAPRLHARLYASSMSR